MIQKRVGINGTRLLDELASISCYPPGGKPTTYTERAAEKLRKEGLRAGVLEVFGMSNRFHKTDFYYNTATIRFPAPASDSSEIITGALSAFDEIYKENIPFKKLGAHMLELNLEAHEQTILFDKVARTVSEHLKNIFKS
jgi:DNA polymerase V